MTYKQALKQAQEKYNNEVHGMCYTYSNFILLLKPEPALHLVSGDYITKAGEHCAHYWLEDDAGNIYDPTESQFGCVGKGQWKKERSHP